MDLCKDHDACIVVFDELRILKGCPLCILEGKFIELEKKFDELEKARSRMSFALADKEK